MTVTIAAEPPTGAEIEQAIRRADAYYAALYPAESNHLFDPATLSDPGILFLVARRDGRICGMGAIVDRSGYAELKRMWVEPAARGGGIGRRLLAALEQSAHAMGHRLVRLETGVRQPEALALYRRSGYAERGPYGAYGPDPLSVFMEKRLD